jgi:unsaturated rhamnogalacturonyl hydrolase
LLNLPWIKIPVFSLVAPSAGGSGFKPEPSQNDEGLNWSLKMTDSMIERRPSLSERWDYEFGLMLKAIWEVWSETGDRRLYQYIQKNMDQLVDPSGKILTYEIEEYNLDQINAGKVLFLLYEATGDERYRKAILTLREQLRSHPRTASGGLWHKKIYPYQMWLDGIYMASPFYAEYAKVFNEPEGFDDVAKQILLITERTRDEETGLYYHGWDETKSQAWADPRTGCSPHFWGRSMGWLVMAIVDVLDFLPPDHPSRQALIEILRSAAAAVAKVQDPKTGLWYQVMDQGERAGNYLEASGSSMFVYGFAKGVKQGYLDRSYLELARRGYRGIIEHFITIDAGLVNLNRICKVAGLGKSHPEQAYRNGTYEYYIGEPIVSNDYKGVGPFILAGVALERAS